jgi:hypothetical protein
MVQASRKMLDHSFGAQQYKEKLLMDNWHRKGKKIPN